MSPLGSVWCLVHGVADDYGVELAECGSWRDVKPDVVDIANRKAGSGRDKVLRVARFRCVKCIEQTYLMRSSVKDAVPPR